MSNPLEVNFSGTTANSSLRLLLPLVDSSLLIPWKTMRFRCPWAHIADSHYRGMNFNFTLNPDPNIDYFENTKKFLIPLVLKTFEKLKHDGLINKLIIVYEWGEYGKKHGKLHFHGLFKSKKRSEVINALLKVFNKRQNLKHRTLRVNHLVKTEDRGRALKYLKKEQHNKLKCLYYT